MDIGVWLLAGFASSVLLHRFGLYLENRGWISYRGKPERSEFGNALQAFKAILNPSARFVLKKQAAQPRRRSAAKGGQ